MTTEDISLREFEQLTSLMFAAALEPARWSDFLDALSRVAGGIGTHMFGHDIAARQSFGLFYSHYAEDYVDSYLQYYAAKNPWASGCFLAPQGVPVYSESVCPRAELLRTEFHNDWLRPQDDISAGGGIILFRENDRMFAIGGNIRQRDEKRLQGRWMRLLGHIGPFLQHAIDINRALAAQAIEKAALAGGANASGNAILVLEGNGRIRFANPAAQALIARGRPLRVDLHGRLEFVDEPARGLLRRALHALERQAGEIAARFVAASAHSLNPANPPDIAHDCRTARFIPDALSTALPVALIDPNRPCLLLTLTPLAPTIHPLCRLAAAWRLTPSEAEIALLLGDGLCTQEIAEQRQVSVHTVRAQIKSLLAKSSARRQADLVRQIVTLCGTGGGTT